MPYRIAMIGAGSAGFSLAVARELIASSLFEKATFVLMDISAERLAESETRLKALARQANSPLKIESTTDRRRALDGANFVVTAYAPARMDLWLKDIEIAGRHGVELLQGENGGPAGQIHALRNISLMMEIVADIKDLCPDVWLLNFTNPMSMLCTYLYKHTAVKSLGFCHQVHGSIGVAGEMLGYQPGDLRVITAGINHMNFLLDIRKRGSGESCLEEFLAKVRQSPYWRKNQENIPEQVFTLEFLNTFGIYPVGYDGHICEYMPFFYSKAQWEKLGYRPTVEVLRELQEFREKPSVQGTINDVEPERILGKGLFPFPKDPMGEYYKESPVAVMAALLTSEPQYFDALILLNRGCVANLPADAVVDIPGLVVGGRARGVEVGELPFFAAELCRRQIAVHELVAQAAVEGSRELFLQALCLDPFVHNLEIARRLRDDYLNEYKRFLPQFF